MKDLLIVLSITLVSGFICLYIFAFMQFQTDSPGYLNAIAILCGQDAGPDELFRLTKPFSLLFPALICSLFGLSAVTGLLIQQFICYLASARLIFLIIKKIRGQKEAYLGLFILLAAQPFAIYGLSLMVDGIAWTAQLFFIYYYLLIKDRDKNLNYVLLGILLGLGLFIKETVFVSGLFIATDLIISKNSAFRKFDKIINIGIPFILLVIVGNLLNIYLLNISILDWWKFAHSDPKMQQLNIFSYLQQLNRSLDLFWIAAIWGIILSIIELKKAILDKKELALILSGVIGIIIFPLFWSYRTDRIIFMMSLLLIPAAAKGLGNLGKMSFPFLGLAVFSNILMTYRIFRYEESGWIIWTNSLFSLLFIIIILLQKIRKFE